MSTTYLADLPPELIREMLAELDYLSIKRLCDSSSAFRRMCALPYFKRLIEIKRTEYQEYRHGLETELIEAAMVHDNTRIKELLALGVNTNARGTIGIEDLLIEGVNIGVTGTTALQEAIYETHRGMDAYETVKLLIDAGADVDAVGIYGETPLISVMSLDRNAPLVELLIDAGADLNVQDVKGKTALMHAVDLSSDRVLQMLVDAGADVNLRNIWGNTALSLATTSTEGRILLEAGARE